MKRLALIIVFVLGFASPVWADFQAGLVAHSRGDYATAPMRALTIALLLLATPALADVAGVASVIDAPESFVQVLF